MRRRCDAQVSGQAAPASNAMGMTSAGAYNSIDAGPLPVHARLSGTTAMPIYEYRCQSCNNDFETLVRSSGPAPSCPQCHSTNLEKKLSTFAAHTAGASPASALPAACGSCGHPGGPGSCGMAAHHH